jgi:V/A-type H+-transporting ATPase subunit A
MQRIGIVERVSGPIITGKDIYGVAMMELVYVGEERLMGEVIRLRGDRATIQVYEDTEGLKPGAPLYPTGHPTSVRLGPGLIGGIFDGIQRPLVRLEEIQGPFMDNGGHLSALDDEREWQVEMTVTPGEEVHGGQVIATVQETPLIQHRVMVPPGYEGRLVHVAPSGFYRVQDQIAVIEDKHGKELPLTLAHQWPVRVPRPYKSRLSSTVPLLTGQRVIDTFFPIGKGGAAAIPGGFGTGKTRTQHQLAKWSDADIIVYIGCGERGNEMTEVLITFPELQDPESGHSLIERTILIANTSNMPVAAREASIYTGITIAEYYRDMGYDVALMADSTSRWAEALREISGRLEELPAEEGFPPYLATRLAHFYERAGRVGTLGGDIGSLTIVGAVSPPGGDFSEPVTQHTKRFVRCFWALDRELANARHYPAINWMESYSEYTRDMARWFSENVDPSWNHMRDALFQILAEEEKYREVAQLVGEEALPDEQRLILQTADIIKEGFLQQNALDPIDTYCSAEKQLKMMNIILTFYREAKKIIERGAPIIKLAVIDSIGEMRRMKNTFSNDELDKLDALLEELTEELSQLEREYRG